MSGFGKPTPRRHRVSPSVRCTTTRSPGGRWIAGGSTPWLRAASVRVQHRSGALWVLSSAALAQVGVPGGEAPGGETPAGRNEDLDAAGEGIERDGAGRPTGRLFRLDTWLRGRLANDRPADLAAVGRRLVAFGVTGVTDCTPTPTADYFDTLAEAVRTGALPLRVAITGGPDLSDVRPPAPLHRGPVKIIITDHLLPSFGDLVAWFTRAHGAGRPVAVHCVTRAALLLALAVWQDVGSVTGDRIEHASVTPPDAIAAMARLSLTVVTQPAFIAARGDVYLRDVEPADRPDLYRCASLVSGGVEVGGSTDAPFGPDDPWLAIGAASERRAPSGAAVGSDRGLEAAAALGLFLGPLERPGGPARRVRPGAPADLCLLDVPLDVALREPTSRHVALDHHGGRAHVRRLSRTGDPVTRHALL